MVAKWAWLVRAAQAQALTNSSSTAGSRPPSRVVLTVGSNISEQQLVTEIFPLKPEASTGTSTQGAQGRADAPEGRRGRKTAGAAGGVADTPPRD